MLRKVFGGMKMTWPRLILFAVISGVITGLIALFVPEGNSIRQIAVTFEAWIVLAIVVIVNCDNPLDAACKTFVYFLISQPLVYLVQVPFNSMGFGLFRFYYPYWFWWTVATFPGAFIAWYIKRDNIPGAMILSVALSALIFLGSGYLRQTITKFPAFLLATLFCYGMVLVLILAILHKKPARLAAVVISLIVLGATLFIVFRNGVHTAYSLSFGLDAGKYPVTEEWTAQLEEPDNGTVTLHVGDGVISSYCQVEIIDIDKPADIILTDPEGNTFRIPAVTEETANGRIIMYTD